jgi:deoxyribodipyrimidine photo-lyase
LASRSDRLEEAPVQLSAARFVREQALSSQDRQIPDLESIGFRVSPIAIPATTVRNELLIHYADRRNLPALDATTRLGVHLRFGTVSIRRLARAAVELKADVWLSELIWREFFMSILAHFPHVTDRAFRAEYDRIEWRNSDEDFESWCAGRTGYPLVDAGMRELDQTGFMHNRVRMVAGSFLVKHLLIDWRRGEAHFARKLLDFDLSANNGNWQWVAGTGCDAAPYFRVFNPSEQIKKFDSKMEYIKRWVPEFGSSRYPEPMVDHRFARQRALDVYKRALKAD